jgi:hypothetical protein
MRCCRTNRLTIDHCLDPVGPHPVVEVTDHLDFALSTLTMNTSHGAGSEPE